MDSVLKDIESIIQKSEDKYGSFASTHEAIGVAVEEWDELREAIHLNDIIATRNECIDLAAVLIRLARSIDARDRNLINRSTK